MSLEGSWNVAFTTAVGVTEERWDITTVDGEVRLHGTSADNEPTDAVLAVDGDAFSFDVPVPNMPMKVQISGQVEGDTLTGAGKLAVMQIGTFVATRTA